jgi:hypothetical protein
VAGAKRCPSGHSSPRTQLRIAARLGMRAGPSSIRRCFALEAAASAPRCTWASGPLRRAGVGPPRAAKQPPDPPSATASHAHGGCDLDCTRLFSTPTTESPGNGAPFGAHDGGRLGRGERPGSNPGEALARQGRTQPIGDTSALPASPAGCHPGLHGAPSLALECSTARSSMPAPVHAAMASPTDQLSVLASLVPEAGIGAVVHGDRRRSAAVEHEAPAASGAAAIARHEPPLAPSPPNRRAEIQLVEHRMPPGPTHAADSSDATPVTHGPDEPSDEHVERTPNKLRRRRCRPLSTMPPPALNGLQTSALNHRLMGRPLRVEAAARRRAPFSERPSVTKPDRGRPPPLGRSRPATPLGENDREPWGDGRSRGAGAQSAPIARNTTPSSGAARGRRAAQILNDDGLFRPAPHIRLDPPHSPVTPEVAGSSPVAPASRSSRLTSVDVHVCIGWDRRERVRGWWSPVARPARWSCWPGGGVRAGDWRGCGRRLVGG